MLVVELSALSPSTTTPLRPPYGSLGSPNRTRRSGHDGCLHRCGAPLTVVVRMLAFLPCWSLSFAL
jgi:hypothetical protein